MEPYSTCQYPLNHHSGLATGNSSPVRPPVILLSLALHGLIIALLATLATTPAGTPITLFKTGGREAVTVMLTESLPAAGSQHDSGRGIMKPALKSPAAVSEAAVPAAAGTGFPASLPLQPGPTPLRVLETVSSSPGRKIETTTTQTPVTRKNPESAPPVPVERVGKEGHIPVIVGEYWNSASEALNEMAAFPSNSTSLRDVPGSGVLGTGTQKGIPGETTGGGGGSATLAEGGEAGTAAGGGNGTAARGNAFIAYMAQIKRLIEERKEYPLAARRLHVTGKCRVQFILGRRGSVKQVTLVESSGSEFLDNAATRAVSDVGRFPPFPAEIRDEERTFSIPISFRLN